MKTNLHALLFPLLILLFLFVMPLLSAGQVTEAWVQRYSATDSSEDRPSTMALDRWGNVYVTGATTIKYNNSGVLQWIRHNEGPDGLSVWANDIIADAYGNVYLTGYSYGPGTLYDFVTIKFDTDGNMQWTRLYNGPANHFDLANAIALDANGNVYVTGQSYTTTSNMDYITIKYTSGGTQEWTHRYNGTANAFDVAGDIAVDANGNAYVSGISAGLDPVTGQSTGYDYATIKYNLHGAPLWVARYDAPAHLNDGAQGLALDPWGHVIVTGWSEGLDGIVSWTTVKYNPSGSLLWQAPYYQFGGEEAYNIPSDLKVDGQGQVYITGQTGHSSFSDIYTVKYSASGTLLWDRMLDLELQMASRPGGLALDEAGNVYINGTTSNETFYAMFALFTAKYDPNGSLEWLRFYDGPPEQEQNTAVGLAVDANRNVFTVGYNVAEEKGSDYITIKYSQPLPLQVMAGRDTTLYLGLSNCITLKAEASGGTAPYTFTWRPGGATAQEFRICPEQTTTYTVIVTDASGVQATDEITVTIADLRCGNKNDKVTVCHKGKTLCISPSAVNAHLNHGDVLGSCGQAPIDPAFVSKPKSKEKSLRLSSDPNPAHTFTRIRYELTQDSRVRLQIHDAAGRPVTILVSAFQKSGRYTVHYNTSHLHTGLYYYTLTADGAEGTVQRTGKLMIAH